VVTRAALKSLNRMFMGLLSLAAARLKTKDKRLKSLEVGFQLANEAYSLNLCARKKRSMSDLSRNCIRSL
jgi:hypothetical protein